MSFATEVDKSVADARVLVEMDVGQINTQWVNHGAGIWTVDTDNSYSWVDDTLLSGDFSAQRFGAVGSVFSDGSRLTQVDSLGDLTSPLLFYYDRAGHILYVILQGYDHPELHTIVIGVAFTYSHFEFTPPGAYQSYQGRLTGNPEVSIASDPLFFGRITFGGGSITLINQDGELDTIAQESYVYGNEVRVYVGYASLTYTEYQRIFTGYIDSIDVSEDIVSVSVADRRKQLSRAIEYTATAENPIESIRNILTTYFDASYTSTYFDDTGWASAESAITQTVTLDPQEPTPASDVIEALCVAASGVFYVNADGKYAFRVIDPSATTSTIIRADDIINSKMIQYMSADVVSSFRVGYARDWATTGTQYTYATYTSAESSVYNQYKTYNQREQDTYLAALADANTWAGLVYPRHTDVHGVTELTVPLKYYATNIAETVDVEIERPQKTMLGTVVSEIKSISWSLGEVPTMRLGVRFV